MGIYETFGIIATVIILISFTFTDLKCVRIINSIGSAIFAVYGILIGAPSVYVLNFCCIGVNAVKIIRGDFMKSEEMMRRKAVLFKMHDTVMNIDDESAYTRWILTVPDDPTSADMESIAESDQSFLDVVDIFTSITSSYIK